MSKPLEPREIALLCADVAYAAKGENVTVLEVDRILVITSYFILVTGRSRKHLHGIADAISRELRDVGVHRIGREGYEEGRWVLLDFGEVIVQLFDAASRRAYDLDTIWGDAPRVPFTPKPLPKYDGIEAIPAHADLSEGGADDDPELRDALADADPEALVPDDIPAPKRRPSADDDDDLEDDDLEDDLEDDDLEDDDDESDLVPDGDDADARA